MKSTLRIRETGSVPGPEGKAREEGPTGLDDVTTERKVSAGKRWSLAGCPNSVSLSTNQQGGEQLDS